jgi:hypothetical protein
MARNANTDGLINCLLQPGLLLDQRQKSTGVTLLQHIKFCYTRTVPAAQTKSIGLQAGARTVMVFAGPPRQFNHDETNPAHLMGPRHLDNFILTRKCSSTYRDFAKTHATATQTATQLNRRAVRLQ